MDRFKAASFGVYLDGVSHASPAPWSPAVGFSPIATARSSTGEYTLSIFQVVVISLLISWMAAVIVIPYLGYHLLPAPKHGEEANRPGWFARLPLVAPIVAAAGNFYTHFRDIVEWCITWRKSVIAITVGAFALAVAGFGLVQQQFFPSSTRLELLVDRETSRRAAPTGPPRRNRENSRPIWSGQKALYENYVSYVGTRQRALLPAARPAVAGGQLRPVSSSPRAA